MKTKTQEHFYTCRYKGLSDKMCLEPTVNGQECANHAPSMIWPQDGDA